MTRTNIKRIFQIVLLTGTAVSLFFVPWILVKAWILPLPDTVQEQVEQSIGHGFDGMIVYVDRAGEAPTFYTGGWKDREAKTAAEANSLFKIASISKLYTAVAITKLVKDGRLSFEQSLAYHLPELAGSIENAEQITLKMMVQHRSGIPNFTDNPAYWEDEKENSKRPLDFVLDLPANFAPDADYQYSNTNYLLLRQIMDKVLGYDHNEFIQERILDPLGLKNTFFSIEDVDLDDVMSGYYVGYEQDFKHRDFGMLATAEDVGNFIRALNDGSVFAPGEQELYPYEYEHGGLVIGYQSLAEYHEDIDAVVVQFINTTDFEGYEWNLSQISMNRIVKILKKQKLEQEAIPKLTPSLSNDIQQWPNNGQYKEFKIDSSAFEIMASNQRWRVMLEEEASFQQQLLKWEQAISLISKAVDLRELRGVVIMPINHDLLADIASVPVIQAEMIQNNGEVNSMGTVSPNAFKSEKLNALIKLFEPFGLEPYGYYIDKCRGQKVEGESSIYTLRCASLGFKLRAIDIAE